MKAIRLLIAVQALIVNPIFAQNLLTNGGFESASHSPGSITGLSVGSSGLSGWTISGTGSVFLVTGPLSGSFNAFEGQQFISFNGNDVRLSQSFDTVSGASYEVSFVTGYYQSPYVMSVTAQVFSPSGDLLGSQLTIVPKNVGWDSPSRFRFVATSNSALLQFSSSNATPNVDLLMDAVSVEPVSRPLSIGVADVRLCWDSQTNRFYQLQYESALTSNNWVDLNAPVAGTGSTICTIQPISDPRRFFRVILLP